jgi:hypothetical protein
MLKFKIILQDYDMHGLDRTSQREMELENEVGRPFLKRFERRSNFLKSIFQVL